MKTTPEGLTHLVNMLVDVVNLQCKAQGTPGARCDVELDFAEVVGKVAVKVLADVDVTAPLRAPLSADNTRTLTPAEIEAAEDALERSGYRVNGLDEVHGVTARQAVIEVLKEVGLEPAAG
jgi:hypothetical protein